VLSNDDIPSEVSRGAAIEGALFLEEPFCCNAVDNSILDCNTVDGVGILDCNIVDGVGV
jgi:hypothetical protein